VKGSAGQPFKQDLVKLSAKSPGEQLVIQTLFYINYPYLHFPLHVYVLLSAVEPVGQISTHILVVSSAYKGVQS
jgi:hypothetical protein